MRNNRSIGSRIAILGRLYAKHLNERILVTGITGSQWAIIKCLSQKDGLTQAAVCEMLSVEASTISKTLFSMERAGWIKRVVDDADKREKKVVLTKKAKEQFDLWAGIAGKVNAKALVGVDNDDIACLDRVLDQILNNLRGSNT